MSKGLSPATFTGAERGALRRLVSPGWIALHVIALVGFACLVGLGRWQWQRAVELERLQNYSYALEWWLFAAFAVFLWLKTMADTLEEAAESDDEQPAPLPTPIVAPVDDADDPELAAYNRHLAALHARHQAEQ